MKKLELKGMRFGRWMVLREGSSIDGRPTWFCRCDCGEEREIRGTHLRCGRSKSCGCLQKDVMSEIGKSNSSHGMTGTKEYRCWNAIRQRCENPRARDYQNYGGRGIQVCEAWRKSFEEFFKHMGPAPSLDSSIERIDNSRGYEPDNCKWCRSFKEQARNRRSGRMLRAFGKTQSVAEWSEETGMPYSVIWQRCFKGGWEPERALTQQIRCWSESKKVNLWAMGNEESG